MKPATRAVATTLRPLTSRARVLRDARGRPALTLIGWHRVDGQDSEGLSTGLRDFAAHLDVLESWGARVLPLDQAVADLHRGTLPPRAVALTFDDGYASVIDTAWPLLRERGWPATLFIVTDSLSRSLTFHWDDHARDRRPDRFRLSSAEEVARAAAEGLDIGSHTCTHPLLPTLDDHQLLDEMARSRTALAELLGREVTSIAYPTGAWNRRVREAAGSAGYRIGITVDRGVATTRSDLLSLPRAFVPHNPDDLGLLLDGAYTYLKPLDLWRRRRGDEQ